MNLHFALEGLIKRFSRAHDTSFRAHQWLWSCFAPLGAILIASLELSSGQKLAGVAWMTAAVVTWAGLLGVAILDGWPLDIARPWSDGGKGMVCWGVDGDTLSTNSMGIVYQGREGWTLKWSEVRSVRVRIPIYPFGLGAVVTLWRAITRTSSTGLIQFSLTDKTGATHVCETLAPRHYDARVQRALLSILHQRDLPLLGDSSILNIYLHHYRDMAWYEFWPSRIFRPWYPRTLSAEKQLRR